MTTFKTQVPEHISRLQSFLFCFYQEPFWQHEKSLKTKQWVPLGQAQNFASLCFFFHPNKYFLKMRWKEKNSNWNREKNFNRPEETSYFRWRLSKCHKYSSLIRVPRPWKMFFLDGGLFVCLFVCLRWFESIFVAYDKNIFQPLKKKTDLMRNWIEPTSREKKVINYSKLSWTFAAWKLKLKNGGIN